MDPIFKIKILLILLYITSCMGVACFFMQFIMIFLIRDNPAYRKLLIVTVAGEFFLFCIFIASWKFLSIGWMIIPLIGWMVTCSVLLYFKSNKKTHLNLNSKHH